MKTKFALVLSGGGFNGAFQVGALNYISQNWKSISGSDQPMKFDLIAGVSTGAINGAMVAMNQLDLLQKLWVDKIAKSGASEIYTSEFIDTESKEDRLRFKFDIAQLSKRLDLKIDLNLSWLEKIGLVISKSKRKEIIDRLIGQIKDTISGSMRKLRSIANNTPLQIKLRTYLNRSKIKNTTFVCGFVSLNTGNYHSVKHDDFYSETDFINGVIASTSIPVVWEPVDKVSFYEGLTLINAHNNVDGGLMNVSPLGDVIKLICEDSEDCKYKIIVVNCNSGYPKYEAFSNKSIGAIAARSIYDLTLTEIFRNDFNNFLRINDIVRQLMLKCPDIVLQNEENRPIKAFDAIVINPEKSFDLGNPLAANEDLIMKRIEHGFNQAKKAF